MVSGITSIYPPRRLNKEFSLKFYLVYKVRQETSEEGRRTYRPKRCEYNDEDNSVNILSDENDQVSCQKFRQIRISQVRKWCIFFSEKLCILLSSLYYIEILYKVNDLPSSLISKIIAYFYV